MKKDTFEMAMHNRRRKFFINEQLIGLNERKQIVLEKGSALTGELYDEYFVKLKEKYELEIKALDEEFETI